MIKIKDIILTEKYGKVLEHLTKSEPLLKAKEIILRHSGKNINSVTIEDGKYIKIDFKDYDSNEFEFLDKLITNLGYSVSNVFVDGNRYTYGGLNQLKNIKEKNPSNFFITIEQLFGDKYVSDSDRVFHVCPYKNLQSVLKIGLKPNTKNKISSHPERIYFALTIKDAISFWNKCKWSDVKNNVDFDYSLLEIDLEKVVNRVHDFQLYYDAFSNGVYCLCNMPPNAIKVIEEKIEDKQKVIFENA